MKPYYDDGRGIVIYCGDWIEFTASLSLVDCCITDPPYGETSLDWDSAEIAWLSAMNRLICRTGSIWSFGSLKYLTWLLRSAAMAHWKQSQELVWEKHNGSSFHADRFKRVHELVVHLYRSDVPWSEVYKSPVTTPDATARAVRRKQRPPHTGHIEAGSYVSHDGGPRLMRSVIFARSCHGEAVHPTQKPLEIIRPLIEYSCPPGGTALDPFSGSGSVLVAAKEMGRKAIGIELQEKYCELAAQRLSQSQIDFAPVPEPHAEQASLLEDAI